MANNLLQQVRTDVVQFLSGESILFSNESDLQLRLSCYLKLSGHYDRVEVEYYVPFQELQRLDPSLTTANFPWDSDLYIDIVVEKDGTFTNMGGDAIENVEATLGETASVYDVQGRLVRPAMPVSQALQGLPQGMYILRGASVSRKVLVK